MSTELIKAAFNAEAAGVAVCQSAQVEYIGDSQVLTITGLIGSKPFTHRTEPFKKGHVLPPSFMQVFGQTLEAKTNEINAADRIVEKIIHDPLPVIERPRAMGITNAGSLGERLAGKVKAAQDRIAIAEEKANGGFARMDRAAIEVEKVADVIEREASELESKLGQITNFSPE
jgi:hypothetical protein